MVVLFACLFVVCCVHSYRLEARYAQDARAVRAMWKGGHDVEWYFRRQN